MSTDTEPRTVNCTQCGAPLVLNGGHRVRSLSCGHCGSVLDTREEYKAVQGFRKVVRPPLPLPLGAKGTIKGVEFTVIGVVQYEDAEGYRWLEYQIFSPTHGYPWLNCTDGHFVFSRRVREIPRIPGKQKATFKVGDRTYKVYESYRAKVRFVEGELTYVAAVGDEVAADEGVSPPFVFTRERTRAEEEYQLGEYLTPAEVYQAFGIRTPPPKPSGIHGAQPYVPSPLALSVSTVARWFVGPVALVTLAIALFGGGTRRLQAHIPEAAIVKGVDAGSFEVEKGGRLMAVNLHAPLDNAWAWYEITIMKGKQAVARLGPQISYYHGYDGGESWTEGSRYADAYFRLREPGTYTVHLRGTGGVGNRSGAPQARPLDLTLREGVLVSRWFVILTVLMVLAAVWQPFQRLRFESKRWEAVEEDDE